MADPAAPPQLVASFATLSGAAEGEPVAARHPFADRCAAAAAAGFTGIGLHVREYERLLAQGMTPSDVGAVLDHTGLRVVELEFLSGWAVAPEPRALRPARPAGIPAVIRRPPVVRPPAPVGGPFPAERTVHELADRFRARHVAAGELGGAPGPFDVELAARRLRGVCERAADHGLGVALAPFPWSPIGDVRTALALVALAGAGNAGLLVDAWTFFHTGGSVADLAGLRPRDVSAVRLTDGPRLDGDAARRARTPRRLPGEGELDLCGLVRRLVRIGFDGPFSVEVSDPALRPLPVVEAARAAFAAASTVVRRARAAEAAGKELKAPR